MISIFQHIWSCWYFEWASASFEIETSIEKFLLRSRRKSKRISRREGGGGRERGGELLLCKLVPIDSSGIQSVYNLHCPLRTFVNNRFHMNSNFDKNAAKKFEKVNLVQQSLATWYGGRLGKHSKKKYGTIWEFFPNVRPPTPPFGNFDHFLPYYFGQEIFG